MESLKNLWLHFEAMLPPELEAYGTEIITAAAVGIIIILAVFLKCCFGGRRRGRSVCFLGLSDAGKTLLFMRLTFGFMRTQNSIKENKAEYKLGSEKSKPVDLVDIPGDERVRERLFSKYKSSLRAVIVVIDSVSVNQDVRNVAELVYDLLSDGVIRRGNVPVLFACNKQDIALARGCNAIKTLLEKEISALRLSRGAKLAAIEGPKGKGQTAVSFLGKKGKDFEFSDLRVKVDFVGCSARGKGEEEESVADIDAVKKWIEQQC